MQVPFSAVGASPCLTGPLLAAALKPAGPEATSAAIGDVTSSCSNDCIRSLVLFDLRGERGRGGGGGRREGRGVQVLAAFVAETSALPSYPVSTTTNQDADHIAKCSVGNALVATV